MAYSLHKMFIGKTWFKTYNSELLAIIKAFKMWQHYLENCKHKILMVTNYNNRCCFIEKKSFSYCQVCWAQELSKYYFQIDYSQKKANGAADALSCFSQWDVKKKLLFELKTLKSFIVYSLHWTNASISSLDATISSLLSQY